MSGCRFRVRKWKVMPHKITVLLADDHALVRRGYVWKNAMDLDLVSAVKSIAAGMTVLDPQVSRKDTLKGERGGGLTPRELEVLQHIVAGKSNKEIASDLNLSVNTVAVHRANIMDTLGIHKTAELVVYAIRNGLVNLP